MIGCVFFLDAKGVGAVWTAEWHGGWGLYIAPHAKFSKFDRNATPFKMLSILHLSSACDAPLVTLFDSNLSTQFHPQNFHFNLSPHFILQYLIQFSGSDTIQLHENLTDPHFLTLVIPTRWWG